MFIHACLSFHYAGTKTKKWKNLYCVLNSKEELLYFYENPKRTRPKAIVHLSYSALYMVHDSLFDKPFCFQLVERTLPWYVIVLGFVLFYFVLSPLAYRPFTI